MIIFPLFYIFDALFYELIAGTSRLAKFNIHLIILQGLFIILQPFVAISYG